MQRLGTDALRPCAETSIVAGTAATSTTSPMASCSSRALPMGRSASFSSMNRADGGMPVVSLASALQRSSMRAMTSTSPSSPSKSPW